MVGLVPHIKHVADRLASEEFVALAPDLYHGVETAEPDEADKIMMALDIDRTARDMVGAVDFLAAHPAVTEADVGAIGFCMGGGLVLWLSCLTHRIAAAVPFYGAAPWPQASPDFTKTVAAFQGHYAEDDDWAVPVVAQRLEAELRRHGQKAEFFIYPGTQHAFQRRPAGVIDAGASALAWDRAVRFLKAELES